MREEVRQILLQSGKIFIWQGEQLRCYAELNNQVWAWFNTSSSSVQKNQLHSSKWNYLLMFYQF